MDREGLQTNERERETNETNTAAGKIFGWRKRRLRDDDGGDVRLGLTRRKLPTLRYV